MMTEAPIPTPVVQGYTLNDRIGRGSYAIVFKATSNYFTPNGTRETVAIKCVFKQRICTTQSAQDNLIREIQLLKALRHPHIVQLKDFQWDKNYIYLILEYCNGGDLSGFIRRQRCLPEPVTRKFLQQLASAMRYLRRHNISHMDLKPQNILITFHSTAGRPPRPVLKLGDFGFAMYMRSTDDSYSLRGSPLYMAPEMFLHRSYDARVDLWSIGVILYECIFGTAPFSCSSMDELTEQIKSGSPVELPDRPSISDECRDLLVNLLQRDPARRLTFEEFFDHPFIDLEYAPSEECLNKATALIKDAVRADEFGRKPEAIRSYCRALAYFLPAIQYEEDPAAKEALRAKARQYLRRAEALKASLMPKKRNSIPEQSMNDSNASGPSRMVANFSSQLETEDKDIRDLREAWSDVPEIGATITVIVRAEAMLNGNEERYEEALDKYTLAIETALRVLRSEPKNERRDLLRHAVDWWLDRAQEVKVYLDIRKLNLSKVEEKEAALHMVEENTETMAQQRACVLQ